MRRLGTGILMLIMGIWHASAAQTPKAVTVREALAANRVSDLAPYTDEFLAVVLEWSSTNQRYVRVGYHINPSAEATLIFSRDLKLAGQLGGWVLLTLPDESVVYHRNQVHFAPTHSLEIAVFNPATQKDTLIYPPKPNQAVRESFVRRVAEAYKERGDAWFAEHNHHMNPELFDSALMSDVSLNQTASSLSFTVRYGSVDNAGDPLGFTQNVSVTCTPIQPVEQMRCDERAR